MKRKLSEIELSNVVHQIKDGYLMMCQLKQNLIQLYHKSALKSGQMVCPNCKAIIEPNYHKVSDYDSWNPHESLDESGHHFYGCNARTYREALEAIN